MRRSFSFTGYAYAAFILLPLSAPAWTPLAVTNDALLRMPGTQHGGAVLEQPNQCANCHFDYNSVVEPGTNWMGSMMSQAARDPLFWSTVVVAAQDSIWALGNPNAADLCLRCHLPQGWLGGRSDPPNAALMNGHDYDGVHCTVCHSMMDPFFEDTFAGIREGAEWTNYWDEIGTLPQQAAAAAHASDAQVAAVLDFMNGQGFYTNNRPYSAAYDENAGGQMFINTTDNTLKYASFADANANHGIGYSRYHKSRYFCSTCHDVSNPVLANLGSDPTNRLPSELQSAYSYGHVERTFSEFMLSAFGLQGGAAGSGFYDPAVFETSHAGNFIASCQDCHMPDAAGRACNKPKGLIRPAESTAHPNSGAPVHDMTGGNAWIPRILASTVPGSPNYDPTNHLLLVTLGGATNLTMDLNFGYGLNANALLRGAERAENNLERAASITNLNYNPATGETSFRIVNHTGHKLISGYPEGRRVFVNIILHAGGQILHEVNPYDAAAGTLKGLDPAYSPNSPALAAHESHRDELVFEAKMTSALTGEEKTFHFALATGRYKDNRIPPRGFRYEQAGERLVDPVWHGASVTGMFSAAEYAGGFKDVGLMLPSGATQAVVELYYQTTSREYMEFLRDEINGTGGTLTGTGAGGDPPYLVQTDPWFSSLKRWGDTMWQLWEHNRHLPGAAPIEMAEAELAVTFIPADPVLTVVSAHGTPVPGGTVTNPSGTVVTAAVESVITADGTRYLNTGWTMTGNDPAAGFTNTLVMTHTNNAMLTWLWTTSFWLEAHAGEHGFTDHTGTWVSAGSAPLVQATADDYFHFSHWTGDVPASGVTSNPVAILMDGPKIIAAVFAENLTPNLTPEWWLAVYYPATNDFDSASVSDTDLDGMQAWAEYIAGTIPTNPGSVLAAANRNVDAQVLYWQSVSGRLYTVEYATNLLEGFQPFPDAVGLAATPAMNAYTNRTVTNTPALMMRVRAGRE